MERPDRKGDRSPARVRAAADVGVLVPRRRGRHEAREFHQYRRLQPRRGARRKRRGSRNRIRLRDGQRPADRGPGEATTSASSTSPSARTAAGSSRRGRTTRRACGTRQQATSWVLRGHDGDVYAATFIPDSGRVATAGADGTVRVWEAGGDRLERTFRLSRKRAACSTWRRAPTADISSHPKDETARVWDVETGRTLTRLRGHDGLVFSAAFSPDGSSVVTGGQDLTRAAVRALGRAPSSAC